MQNNWIRTALIGLGVVACVASHAAGRITGVSVSKVGKGVEVLIQGSNLGKPKAGFLETATQYALEFDAQLAIKATKLTIWQNGLESILPSFASGKTKLKFKFTEPVNAVISEEPTGLKVSFDSVDLMAILLAQPELNAPKVAAQSFKVNPEKASKTVPKVAPTVKTPVEILTSQPTPVAKSTTRAAQGFATLPPVIVASKADGYVPTTEPKRAAPQPFMAVVQPTAFSPKGNSEPKVSLDFVDTQIVSIIKSLALQTRTNIVTSPDVTGKLSVKLDRVTVGEALNLVTSLAGLKYAQVGKTYVVTTEAKFAETVRLAQGAKNDAIMSRVVPVYSGQTIQVKLAVLKSVSSETPFGRFEILLPSERTVVTNTPATSNEKDAKLVAEQSTAQTNDPYVMLIGSPGRLDEVENMIRAIDKQLCTALGIKPPKTQEFVTKAYIVHGGRAIDLIEALAGKGKTSIGNVECFATPNNSISKQTVVLRGNAEDVEGVLAAFDALDSDQAATMTEFQVFDLKYTDPRAVREALIANIPGLSVVIAPNAVLNPKVYQEDRLRSQSEQRGTDTPAPQGGGTLLASGNPNGQQALQNGGQGGAQPTQITSDKTDANTGLVLPFDAFEAVGMPMRLIMKGSKDQVDRAVQLIGQMDTPPKQVSLELRVMEVSREELLRLGINWSLFTSGAVKTIRLNNPGATTGDRTVGVSVQGRDVSGDVAAMLDSISNGSRLISRPNMICNDGRSNEVFVGDVIRYIESIISSQNGPTVTQGTVSTGVRLAAFPRLGGDGTINLDLRTKVVYLKGWEVVTQIGGRLPQTSERTAQNSITLKDGETFAIGGLIQQEDRKQMTGLPFLKDLPIFGQFFRSTTRDRVKTEIVIFVTAKMVNIGGEKSLTMEKDLSVDKTGEYIVPAKKKGGNNE